MKSLPFLIWGMLFINTLAFSQREDLTPYVSLKTILISPVGISLELIPHEKIGLQATYQRSVWRSSWRATIDLKYLFWIDETDHFYLAPYLRYKEVELYSINVTGKDCSGFCGDWISGYYYGINFGFQSIGKYFALEMNMGAGFSPPTWNSDNSNDIDLRGGLLFGLGRSFKF